MGILFGMMPIGPENLFGLLICAHFSVIENPV